ncbi:MAG TPA: hypothetical protein VLN57_07480 [Xanthobacteraceae bacterium]|nr:hypothetical protein [Xanthobacteraceae bacterium]
MARTRPQVTVVPSSAELDNNVIPFVLPAAIEARARLRLSVMGSSPLLTHNVMAMLAPAASRGKNIPSPEDEAEAGVYRTQEGRFGLLGEAFRLSALEASTLFKAPKGRGSIQPWLAHIEVEEEFVTLIDPATGEAIENYEIDVRSVVIQRSRILRGRPKFLHWAVKRITILYDEALIPNPTIIPDIMADAGQRRGVGDFRPGKSKGRFGRFAVIAVAYGDGPWQRYELGAAVARIEEVEPELETS